MFKMQNPNYNIIIIIIMWTIESTIDESREKL